MNRDNARDVALRDRLSRLSEASLRRGSAGDRRDRPDADRHKQHPRQASATTRKIPPASSPSYGSATGWREGRGRNGRRRDGGVM